MIRFFVCGEKEKKEVRKFRVPFGRFGFSGSNSSGILIEFATLDIRRLSPIGELDRSGCQLAAPSSRLASPSSGRDRDSQLPARLEIPTRSQLAVSPARIDLNCNKTRQLKPRKLEEPQRAEND